MNQSSRYRGAQTLVAGELNTRAELAPRGLLRLADYQRRDQAVEYTVTQGDRIDVLAYRHLGDSRLWWAIADLNPGVDPLRLRGGETLWLPRL